MKFHNVTHAIAINTIEQVLLIKRAPNLKIYPDLWSIPGGHLENNESFRACLIREIKEELDADVIEIIKTLSPYRKKIGNEIWSVKLFIIKINDIKLNKKEVVDYVWVYPVDIYDFKRTPFLEEHFKKAGLIE